MAGAFDLVIFDCDGVLIDSEMISATMLIAALRDLDLTIDVDYVREHFLGRSYPVVFSKIRTDFGLVLPESFEADYRLRLLAAFEDQLRLMPNVRHVLDDLDVPACVATSSSPGRVARSFEIVGLTQYFADRVFTASDVRRSKPAPDLFLLAAERMGVAPSRCLVIEDSPNGVRAALAAGMEVCRFTGGSHMDRKHRILRGEFSGIAHLDDFNGFFAEYPTLARHADRRHI